MPKHDRNEQIGAASRPDTGQPEAAYVTSQRPPSIRSRPHILDASEQVAAAIVWHIEEKGLKPGDRLGREEDLAEHFSVSKPTLREALRLLASSNRVMATKGPGGGVFVKSTLEDGLQGNISSSIALMLETEAVSLEKLLDARCLIEVPLTGAAAQHASPELVSTLEETIRLFADTSDVAWDAEFHRTIAHASGNRVIEVLADWIFVVLQPRLVETVAPVIDNSAIVRDHEAILEAIRRRDSAAAEAAASLHHEHLRVLLALAGQQERRSRGRPRTRSTKRA